MTQADFERAYFESNYRDYARQNPPRKLHFYRRLVEGLVPGTSNPRILDLGCAFGTFLATLDSRWERFGVDVSRFATEEASRTVPGVAFACAGATEIPFSGPFDVITAFDVIEHIPSLDRVVSAIRGKASANGHLVFVVPVYDGPLGAVVRLLDKDRTHVHKRSRRFWLRWTEEHFDLVEWWGVARYLFPGDVYLHCTTKTWRSFAPAIAVVARLKPRAAGER